jgi:hypothetical protein
MTYLEQRLATLLEAIARVRAAGPSPLLATLLRQKTAICAALAAPEQCLEEERAPAKAPRAREERARAPGLRVGA